jgi:hypothetical protein
MGNSRDRKPTERLIPRVERVIVNKRATVVFWEDGDKIVVRRRKGDKQSREVAVLYAIAEKALGSKTKRSAFIEAVASGEGEPAEERDACKACEFSKECAKELEAFERDMSKAVFGDPDFMKLVGDSKRLMFGHGC